MPAKKNKKPIKKAIKLKTKKIVAKNAKSGSKRAKIVKKPAKSAKKAVLNKNIKKDKKIAKKSKLIKKKAKIVKKLAKLIKKPKKIAKKITKIAKKTNLDKNKKTEKNLVQNKNETSKIQDKKTIDKPKALFKIGEYVVYPSHGIGKVADIETMTVLNEEISCYLLYFEKEKLTVKIPVKNSEKIHLRSLVSKGQMDEVFSILRSGVKKLKGMWSRRAQEYETKINSGDIIMLAEVLRDLTRDIEDGERSYSERIIYETAVARLAAEYATIYSIDFEEAKAKVVITAKDKLGSEEKTPRRDDDFEDDEKDHDNEDEDEDDEEDDEDEDLDDEDLEEDFDDEDDDDDRPRKKRR